MKKGTKFKDLMKSHGFTQLKLSEITGVAQSNLSIYCNYVGTIEASTMVTRMRLAKAFEMEVEEFEEYLDLPPATVIATSKQRGNYKIDEVK